MADNIDVTPGTGKTVATDDVSGVQFQIVKMDFGGNGASAPVTSATPLPVVQTGTLTVTADAGTNLNTSLLALESGGNLATAATNSGTIVTNTGNTATSTSTTATNTGNTATSCATIATNTGSIATSSGTSATNSATIATNTGNTATSTATTATWNESGRAAANIIAGQVGVQGGSGTTNALTQRVVLATDVALPTGTNSIGKLGANSGVTIGDVNVIDVIPGTSATKLGKAEDAAATSGDTGVFALAVRRDTPGTNVSTDGDYAEIQTDNIGQVRTAIAGYTKTITVAKTRPSNTTAYAAGQVLNESTSAGTNWTFANCARVNGGSGTIAAAYVIDGASQSVPPVLELWLFNTNPTPDNDGAVFTPTYGEMTGATPGKLAAIIPLINLSVGTASTNSVQNAGFTLNPFQCAAADTSLYGTLVVRNIYTPISAETFTIQLTIFQD